MGFFDQFYEEASIEKLLNKPDLTLEELVEDDSLIQECKSRNSRIVEFLRQPLNTERIMQWLFKDPKEDTQDHKYAILANEIIQCEIDDLYASIITNDELLQVVLSVLERPVPLPPHVSQPLVKVLTGLVVHRGLHFTTIVASTKVPDFWKHIETHQMGTVITHMLEVRDQTDELVFANWWLEHGLAESIMQALQPAQRQEVRLNAIAVLRDILEDKELLNFSEQLFSTTFLDDIFTILCNDVQQDPRSVLFRMAFECFRSGSEALMSLGDGEALLETLLSSIAQRMEFLATCLINPGEIAFDPPVPAPLNADVRDGPLGSCRLAIVELLAVALPLSPHIQDAVLRHNVLRIVADLVFKYDCHDMLHGAFAAIVQSCLGYPELSSPLMDDVKLLERIVKANDEGRPGLFGHITVLSNLLLEAQSSNTAVQTAAESCEAWSQYVKGDLERRNTRNSFLLGGQKLALLMSQVEKRDITKFDDSEVPKAALLLPPTEFMDLGSSSASGQQEMSSLSHPGLAPPGSPMGSPPDSPPESPLGSPVEDQPRFEVDFGAAFGTLNQLAQAEAAEGLESGSGSGVLWGRSQGQESGSFGAAVAFDADFSAAFSSDSDPFGPVTSVPVDAEATTARGFDADFGSPFGTESMASAASSSLESSSAAFATNTGFDADFSSAFDGGTPFTDAAAPFGDASGDSTAFVASPSPEFNADFGEPFGSPVEEMSTFEVAHVDVEVAITHAADNDLSEEVEATGAFCPTNLAPQADVALEQPFTDPLPALNDSTMADFQDNLGAVASPAVRDGGDSEVGLGLAAGVKETSDDIASTTDTASAIPVEAAAPHAIADLSDESTPSSSAVAFSAEETERRQSGSHPEGFTSEPNTQSAEVDIAFAHVSTNLSAPAAVAVVSFEATATFTSQQNDLDVEPTMVSSQERQHFSEPPTFAIASPTPKVAAAMVAHGVAAAAAAPVATEKIEDSFTEETNGTCLHASAHPQSSNVDAGVVTEKEKKSAFQSDKGSSASIQPTSALSAKPPAATAGHKQPPVARGATPPTAKATTTAPRPPPTVRTPIENSTGTTKSPMATSPMPTPKVAMKPTPPAQPPTGKGVTVKPQPKHAAHKAPEAVLRASATKSMPAPKASASELVDNPGLRPTAQHLESFSVPSSPPPPVAPKPLHIDPQILGKLLGPLGPFFKP